MIPSSAHHSVGVARLLPGKEMAVAHSSNSSSRERRKRSREYFEVRAGGEKIENGGRKGERCGRDFFDRPCEELARDLLGCVLVCRGEDGEECRGEVVEVEAYLGREDRAAHSYNGRRTAANEAMFMVEILIQ